MMTAIDDLLARPSEPIGGVAPLNPFDNNTQLVPSSTSTGYGDLLGFGDDHQPQRQAQAQQVHYRSASPPSETATNTNATVALTTPTFINASTVAISTSSTPTIVGIGKIGPSAANSNGNAYNDNRPKRKLIYVPEYSCNGGLDTKFNPQARCARPSSLHNLLNPEEYEVAIQTLNEKIKKSRAKKIDYLLLGTGPLMVPLALWGARHGKQVKLKRKLIEEGVWEFNERMQMEGKPIMMVWNRRGGGSYLTIEEVEEGFQNSKKVD